jgi:hypothetical protein
MAIPERLATAMNSFVDTLVRQHARTRAFTPATKTAASSDRVK